MEGLWERAEAMQKQMQQPDDGSARLLYLHKLRCEFLPAMDSAAVDTFLDEYLRRATSDPSPRPPPPLAVSPPSTTLTFQRPFTAVVPRTLTLTNTTASDTVLFKAKTTAPRQYCVRPNLGRIPAGATVAVQVLLEPNPPEKRGTDKLMFESVVVPKELAGVLDGNDDDDGEVKARVAQAWKFVDAALARRTDGGGGEGVVHRHKIRCEFVPAGDVVAKDSGAGKAAKTVKESKTAAATAKKLTTVGDKARASQQGKAEKEAPPKVSDSSRRRYATDKPSFLERLFPCCWSREG
ncbi:PapD-like protein [Zopfochytrium polystomum]|nr:PapD-like protein [Zopfochytrium polystomum]